MSTPEITKEMIEYFISLRRVFLSGDIEEKTANEISINLLMLDFKSNDPITLLIKSDGGSVMMTYQLHDTIRSLNSPVNGIIIGDSASMAVDLLQMCNKRYMLPNSTILVHYIRSRQTWICDDLEQLNTDIEFFRKKQKEIFEKRLKLYKEKTGLPEEKIREIFRSGEIHKYYLSAKQALELNLIDEIMEDFKFFPNK